MNLLQDKWITVKRRNGHLEEIAPYQITDGIQTNNPIIEIITPRADFKGALYQFLIGLFQTAYAPKTKLEWEDRFNIPPSTEELKQKIEKLKFAFDLFGKEIRFMQDVSLNAEDTQSNVSALFIESPGESTLKKNRDHFIKRGSIEEICPKCAALALFTLQINSPSGGQGHLTSIRGGGPLTTLLKYDTKDKENLKYKNVWSDLWLNVLPKSSFPSEKKPGKNYEFIFPWVTDQFYKNNSNGEKTTSEDLHAYSVFWSYPRRILLNRTQETFICNICREESEIKIDSYHTKTHGLDYGGGSWIHPLSPYYFKKDKDLGDTWFPYHPQPGGILYHHWLSFVYGIKDKDKNAKTIEYFNQMGRKEGQTLIWSFGYDIDKWTARCWYEITIPIYHISNNLIEKYENEISSFMEVANQIASNLQTYVKDAWFNKRQTPKGDTDFLKIIFYQATESKFYELAKSIRDLLENGNEVNIELKKEWIGFLNLESLKIFDTYTELGAIEFENIQRVVKARQMLILWNLGNKIKEAMEVPVTKRMKEKGVKKK